MLSELHQILLSCGYRYTNIRSMPQDAPLRFMSPVRGFYVKSYETTGGHFSIALDLPADINLRLPNAYILEKPEAFKNMLLPHVNMGWHLCYVREMEADWDPNKLKNLYLQIDHQIQETLNSSITSVERGSPDDREMEGEFSSYWLPEKKLYLLSETSEKTEMQCCIAIDNSESEPPKSHIIREEWIAYERQNLSELDEWLRQRLLKKKYEKTILTSYFKVNPSRLAGIEWPPQNLRALFNWLTEVDLSARSRLLEHFVNNPVKRHVLLFDIENQDLIGLFVEINIAATGLNSYPKNTRRQKKSGRTVKSKTLIPCLSAKHSTRKFTRISVIRSDRKTIFGRNRRRSATGDLSTKRIALIGCGTIGGYLCSLLLRGGAGCGNARFDIYDDDSFGPHNFGRHPLSTSNFGHNKATSLAVSLKTSTHFNCKIEGKPYKFPISSQSLNEYDIVIDATGRPPVAKRLASVVRSISSNKRPVIVHGFNDGNGRASKVLIDDGSCCYGCMLQNPDLYRDGIDPRFKGIKTNDERIISCGSTFTPYDAAVSVITAAMMQEAVLSTLEASLSWTYNEHMLDGNRSKKPQILTRQRNCPICHE